VKYLSVLLVLLAAVAAPVLGQQAMPSPAQPAQAKAAAPPAAPKTHLKVGQAAPDFTLTDTEGKPVSLHDFKGNKNVVLAFYVLAFTGG
jgi:cytochrome oxidase Cu insertion factor (SCO1/SenC/PrrC family)